MPSSLPAIGADLVAALNRLRTATTQRARLAEQAMGEELTARLADSLPTANIQMSRSAGRLLIDVTDDDLRRRERGAAQVNAERAINRALNDLALLRTI